MDAIYVWPDGEIWFSVEDGFNSRLNTYGPGDLLSDRGYVVAKSLDLLSAFQPLEDLSDFGLDALVLVTDLVAPPVATNPLSLAPLALNAGTGRVTLDWTGEGRVFQVEQATNLMGPWLPFSPILIEPPVVDRMTNGPGAFFYRVHQW